jgi:hypothetical protein
MCLPCDPDLRRRATSLRVEVPAGGTAVTTVNVVVRSSATVAAVSRELRRVLGGKLLRQSSFWLKSRRLGCPLGATKLLTDYDLRDGDSLVCIPRRALVGGAGELKRPRPDSPGPTADNGAPSTPTTTPPSSIQGAVQSEDATLATWIGVVSAWGGSPPRTRRRTRLVLGTPEERKERKTFKQVERRARGYAANDAKVNQTDEERKEVRNASRPVSERKVVVPLTYTEGAARTRLWRENKVCNPPRVRLSYAHFQIPGLQTPYPFFPST